MIPNKGCVTDNGQNTIEITDHKKNYSKIRSLRGHYARLSRNKSQKYGKKQFFGSATEKRVCSPRL